MSKFYNLSDDAIEKFNSVFKKKSFPVDVKFQFIGYESQKTLIKISKVSDGVWVYMSMDRSGGGKFFVGLEDFNREHDWVMNNYIPSVDERL